MSIIRPTTITSYKLLKYNMPTSDNKTAHHHGVTNADIIMQMPYIALFTPLFYYTISDLNKSDF